MLGDGDGVMVIPAYLADEFAEECVGMESFDDFVLEQVLDAASIIGLYPPTMQKAQADFPVWRENSSRLSQAVPDISTHRKLAGPNGPAFARGAPGRARQRDGQIKTCLSARPLAPHRQRSWKTEPSTERPSSSGRSDVSKNRQPDLMARRTCGAEGAPLFDPLSLHTGPAVADGGPGKSWPMPAPRRPG
jgi:hypothetical protein